MSLKLDAVKGMKWTGIATVINTSIQVLQLVILARVLSPIDFGIMGITMIVIGFAQAFSDMGISAALISRREISRNQLSSLYWLNVLTGILVYLSVYIATPLAVDFFHESQLARLLPVVSLVFILSASGVQFQMLLQKNLLFSVIAKVDMSTALLGSIVAISCALTGFGVWSIVLGQLSAAGSRMLFLIYEAYRRLWLPHFHYSHSDVRSFLGFGLYQMGERCINYFNARFDQMLIGSMLGTSELGLYNFANNLVFQPSQRLFPLIINVMFPVFSKVQDDTERLRRGYLKLVKVLTILHAPIMIIFIIMAPDLVPLIFGDKWNDSIYIIQVLSIYVLIRSTGSPVGSIQLAKGRADLGFKWNLMLLFITSPVLYFSAKRYGLHGVIWALCFLMVFYSVPSYFFLIKVLIGKCGKQYIGTILAPISLSIGMGILIYFINGFIAKKIIFLIFEIILGLLFYCYLVKKSMPELYLELKGIIIKRKVT